MSPNIAPMLLSREQIIPSSRFTEGCHPSALAAHLSSMIPAPSTGRSTMNALAASVETIKGGTYANSTTGSAKTMKRHLPWDAHDRQNGYAKMELARISYLWKRKLYETLHREFIHFSGCREREGQGSESQRARTKSSRGPH
jgi:hypothetical protein